MVPGMTCPASSSPAAPSPFAFPGWQRSTTQPIASFNLPVPIAARATLDMKKFQDADGLSPEANPNLFKDQMQGMSEHLAQAGIVFDKTPDTPSIGLPAGLNSSIPTFFITNIRPGPLVQAGAGFGCGGRTGHG